MEDNKKEKIILKGVFSEFDTRTKNRPCAEEDYLPHIEELKKKIKEKTNSKFVSAEEYNDLIEYVEEIVKKLDTAIAYAEHIASKGNDLNERIEELEDKSYHLEKLDNGEYILNTNNF